MELPFIGIGESWHKGGGKRLESPGCGCCSHSEEATPENVREAIEATTEFLKQLKKLQKEVSK